MTASAFYEGVVRHRRSAPHPHAFGLRLYLAYLDLDEVDDLFAERWLWSTQRPNLGWFRRADYLGPAGRPLREAVLDRVEAELDFRPAGPVRLLTQLRTFGYVFNPVTFYYCFDADGGLVALVAEITNTPWGQRHAYALDARERAGEFHMWRFRKELHVSPFQPMEQTYEWSFCVPGERLEVRMTNWEGDRPVHHAALDAERREIGGASFARALVRFPLRPLLGHAAIYWNALRLVLKRAPFHVHPDKRRASARAGTETRTHR